MKYGKLFLILALAFSIVVGTSLSQAEENPAANMPGTTAYKMGAVEIIAVSDKISASNNISDIKKILIGDAKRIDQLMPETTNVSYCNTYVVRTEKSITLIDTGWGSALGGKTVENLRKIGITPDMIDAILLTHLHLDHVNGLLNEGEIVFPNATVYVAAPERAYWFDDVTMNRQDDKTWFNIARQGIVAYGDRVRTFAPGTEIVPGIKAINESGHTPGHVGYLVETKDKKMLIWGDLTHITEVQLAAPEIAVVYDVDPKQAIITRQAILSWVAHENILVVGMHLLYPEVGKIIAQEGGGYIFEPLDKLD